MRSQNDVWVLRIWQGDSHGLLVKYDGRLLLRGVLLEFRQRLLRLELVLAHNGGQLRGQSGVEDLFGSIDDYRLTH